jgi:hypothetical protein
MPLARILWLPGVAAHRQEILGGTVNKAYTFLVPPQSAAGLQEGFCHKLKNVVFHPRRPILPSKPASFPPDNLPFAESLMAYLLQALPLLQPPPL